jgi:hypothetical protein
LFPTQRKVALRSRLVRVCGLILAALMLASVLAACDREVAAEKPEKREPVQGPAKPKTIEAPKDWPPEIPLYPGGQIVSTGAEGEDLVILMRTRDQAHTVFNWYYDELQAAEWNMKGPTLDVGQSFAIIRAELGEIRLTFEAGPNLKEDGERDGLSISLRSNRKTP